MLYHNLEEKSKDLNFLKQVERVRNQIIDNTKDSNLSINIDYNNKSVSINNIIYCYVIVKAFEYNNPYGVTLEDALQSSAEYNESIGLYFKNRLNSEIFDLLKNFLINENVSIDVLEYIIEVECSSYEFQTPTPIVDLALKILDIKENETVVDVGSGLGNFIFDGALKYPNSNFTGYEINTERYIISLIRNYFNKSRQEKNNINLVHQDAFDSLFDSKQERKFDKVFANYPVGMQLKFSGIGQRYLKQISNKFSNMIPSSSGDWVYNMLIRDMTTNSPYGKAVGIMASGSSWNNTDKSARRYFLERGIVESVIALPAKLFDYTSIPMMMIVFSFGNKQVRMIDATTFYNTGRRQNYMDDTHIKKIIEYIDIDCEYSKLVSYDELMEQDYVLDPGRYLKQKIKIKNGVQLHTVIKNITRGAQIRASNLDLMVSHTPTNMQYLTLSNIRDGILDEELSYLTSIDDNLEKYCLKDNDLILSKNGYPYKVAVVKLDNNQKILANGSLYIVKLDQEKINPIYLKAFLESEIGKNTLKSITVGVTIPNISVGNLKKIMIPLPPMEEQKVIAEKYMKQLELISAIRIKLEKSIKKLGEIF